MLIFSRHYFSNYHSQDATSWQYQFETFGSNVGERWIRPHYHSGFAFQREFGIFRLCHRQCQSIAFSHPIHFRSSKSKHVQFLKSLFYPPRRQNGLKRCNYMQTLSQDVKQGWNESHHHNGSPSKGNSRFLWLSSRQFESFAVFGQIHSRERKETPVIS